VSSPPPHPDANVATRRDKPTIKLACTPLARAARDFSRVLCIATSCGSSLGAAPVARWKKKPLQPPGLPLHVRPPGLPLHVRPAFGCASGGSLMREAGLPAWCVVPPALDAACLGRALGAPRATLFTCRGAGRAAGAAARSPARGTCCAATARRGATRSA